MKNLKKYLSIKNLLILIIVIALATGGFFVGKKYLKPAPKHMYEAMVQARDQFNSDPGEDLKTSLKIGDVIVVLPEGHNWSETERGSYLIVKMNLTEEQSRLLLSPDSKTEKIEVPSGPDGKNEKQEQETILRARRYRLKTEEMNIKPEDFLGGSTLGGRVFDWRVVEKKAKI